MPCDPHLPPNSQLLWAGWEGCSGGIAALEIGQRFATGRCGCAGWGFLMQYNRQSPVLGFALSGCLGGEQLAALGCSVELLSLTVNFLSSPPFCISPTRSSKALTAPAAPALLFQPGWGHS